MIERILLVSWRELRATLLTRAFILMVLTPLISIAATPLFWLPLATIRYMLPEQNAAKVTEITVEVIDPEGTYLEALDVALPERWKLVTVTEEDPQEARVRLTFNKETETGGRYGLTVKERRSKHLPGDLRPLREHADEQVTRKRLTLLGLPPSGIDEALDVAPELTWIPPPRFDLVTSFQKIQQWLVPSGVLFLMFACLSMAGQGLLTSTLEEKSTRVAEVLLGAVSPEEFLTGKVVGQLGASLLLAFFWGAPTLLIFAIFVSVLLGPLQIFYLLILIGIASLSWAAVMGGIGAVVNDLTEAQHILAPLFMMMMLFFFPAGAACVIPDSPTIVILSLLPPASAPTMAARIASSSPPPHWQVWLGILSSGGFALVLFWAAGRLFRIGLLLRGSPPNFRTLARWIARG